jgi:methionine synthase II (cobalamin-independent)
VLLVGFDGSAAAWRAAAWALGQARCQRARLAFVHVSRVPLWVNGRHGHEWSVFRDHPLPDDKVLLPGVIDTVTNVVEHPDLVAERIERYAGVVGKERVIASTDCGFASAAAAPNVHPSIVQPKLQALVEGSRRASERLWP